MLHTADLRLIPLQLLAILAPLCALAFQGPQQLPLIVSAPPAHPAPKAPSFELELRHIFHRGSTRYPDLHRRLDIQSDSSLVRNNNGVHSMETPPRYRARSRTSRIERLRNRPSSPVYEVSEDGHAQADWIVDKIEEPDVTDKETVLAFARMSNDAYYLAPDDGQWQDIGGGFNYTEDFGWESDGLRGHVFADVTNKTVVIAMKGTSLPFIDPIGTIGNDKLNDNLLFSCCCGQDGRWWWSKVCDCKTAEYQVGNRSCIRDAIREKTRYYHLAQELYHNITTYYPKSNIWLAGHSLGGSVASLLGLTVGQPVVTFEAPADAMAAARLGLPTPPGLRIGADAYGTRASTGVYHFYHTADDIPMGKCNAVNSVCTLGGYAMEAKCHTGHTCVYDTIADKNWSSNARSNHGIVFVIEQVLEAYDKPAECVAERDCHDCKSWKFV